MFQFWTCPVTFINQPFSIYMEKYSTRFLFNIHDLCDHLKTWFKTIGKLDIFLYKLNLCKLSQYFRSMVKLLRSLATFLIKKTLWTSLQDIVKTWCGAHMQKCSLFPRSIIWRSRTWSPTVDDGIRMLVTSLWAAAPTRRCFYISNGTLSYKASKLRWRLLLAMTFTAHSCMMDLGSWTNMFLLPTCVIQRVGWKPVIT